MRKSIAGLSSLALATGLVMGQTSLSSAAAPSTAGGPGTAGTGTERAFSDELPNALETKRRALKEAGLTAVLHGEARAERRNGSTVVKVGRSKSAPDTSGIAVAGDPSDPGTGRDQYVELSREGTDQILTVLAEFGTQRHPDYPDKDVNPDRPGPVVFDGPEHNSIPEPDRSVDNTTVWQADYDRRHYKELYFGDDEQSLKSYFERQSSGRYSVAGKVAGWVEVPYNEARYGRSSDVKDVDPNVCAGAVCPNAQALVTDSITAMVKGQQRRGLTPEQVKASFARFDEQDRYDYDGDGDFNEADGYIDHFQVVHAGGDESDGDPQQGEDALWAHRWYVAGQDVGKTGPEFNKLGGTPVGGTGLFIGDYTMQPENGGVSVFTHEYGHDLGLPDHYDTSGGGSNGVEFWNLMAQSRLNAQGEPLGTRAGDLSAWDKLQLGWLDHDTVRTGQERTVKIGPHEYNSAKAQALLAVLPKKEVEIPYGAPASGEKQYFTGNADNLASSLTFPVDLSGQTDGEFRMAARFNIESEFDHLYVQYSENGTDWTALDGTVDGEPFDRDRDRDGDPAISGASGGDERIPLAEQPLAGVVVPLDALAGGTGQLRLHYRTDGGVMGGGAVVDDLTITAGGQTLLSDDAEGTPKGELDGFTVVGASSTQLYDNYYLASNRSYVSYDKYLETGPYNFSDPKRPDWVEHFSYQQGLLVSYWDTSFTDNNTSQHPGQGMILPVDAHPEPVLKKNGTAWRTRVQVFDAPFSRIDAKSFTLHDTVTGEANRIKGQPATTTFDDTRSYWSPIIPTSSVQVPKTGTTMKVKAQNGTSMTVEVGYEDPAG